MRVAACGEAAPVLLARGKREAAVRLERLWDRIAAERDVALELPAPGTVSRLDRSEIAARGVDGVSIERVVGGEHEWLTALGAGGTLGAAIEAAQRVGPAFDLAQTLRAHIAAGTITAIVDR